MKEKMFRNHNIKLGGQMGDPALNGELPCHACNLISAPWAAARCLHNKWYEWFS